MFLFVAFEEEEEEDAKAETVDESKPEREGEREKAFNIWGDSSNCLDEMDELVLREECGDDISIEDKGENENEVGESCFVLFFMVKGLTNEEKEIGGRELEKE